MAPHVSWVLHCLVFTHHRPAPSPLPKNAPHPPPAAFAQLFRLFLRLSGLHGQVGHLGVDEVLFFRRGSNSRMDRYSKYQDLGIGGTIVATLLVTRTLLVTSSIGCFGTRRPTWSPTNSRKRSNGGCWYRIDNPPSC